MIYKRESIEGTLQATEDTIISICAKYQKAYCYPGQETLRRLLKERHGIDICRRTLNHILRWLEDHGSFKRTRRHRKGPNGRILFATTMYTLKKKLFIRLNTMKKWIDRVTSPLRVQVRAQYRSMKQNEIFKVVSPEGGNHVEIPIEGRSSPLFDP